MQAVDALRLARANHGDHNKLLSFVVTNESDTSNKYGSLSNEGHRQQSCVFFRCIPLRAPYTIVYGVHVLLGDLVDLPLAYKCSTVYLRQVLAQYSTSTVLSTGGESYESITVASPYNSSRRTSYKNWYLQKAKFLQMHNLYRNKLTQKISTKTDVVFLILVLVVVQY